MAADILHTIAEHNRMLVAHAKQHLSEAALAEQVWTLPATQSVSFETALRKPGLSFICEVKKASPSKGIIAEEYPYLTIARDYARAGADAISCLTEPAWFMGSMEHLKAIAAEVDLPVMRKDFIVDSYQLYEAKLAGAQAVLLLCGILDDHQLTQLMELADTLGLSTLVEAYCEDEVHRAVRLGARIIGVNNRDLRDFSVDFAHAQRLRELVPSDRVFVAESGVTNLDDIATIARLDADAVLIGEFLMRSPHRGKLLNDMRATARREQR